ncbi:MAG: arginase family protein [Polyangiaceae bacterium]
MNDGTDATLELATLLRPAGGGVYLVSTGKDEQLAFQRRLYGVSTDAEVGTKWRASLEAIRNAKAILLAVPSDVGAGFLRGANMGPSGIRAALEASVPDWPRWMADRGVVDVGDVFVVPQLLHDSMLSEAQKEASRRAIYPDAPAPLRDRFPVSPLSIAERALDLVFALNPDVVPLVLGGDHSCAWPVSAALSRARVRAGTKPWGIVQIDAHTDLLEERLGVRYCFGTWSFHANDLLGRGGKMVQVGIRATRRDRSHWESTLGVVQHWAKDCNERPEATIASIVDHFRALGVGGVYFSNDIDGTDEAFADATGTPEPGGLSPDFVVALIRALGREIGLVAGDVMEVAPPVKRTPHGDTATCALAARYVRETIEASLGGPRG